MLGISTPDHASLEECQVINSPLLQADSGVVSVSSEDPPLITPTRQEAVTMNPAAAQIPDDLSSPSVLSSPLPADHLMTSAPRCFTSSPSLSTTLSEMLSKQPSEILPLREPVDSSMVPSVLQPIPSSPIPTVREITHAVNTTQGSEFTQLQLNNLRQRKIPDISFPSSPSSSEEPESISSCQCLTSFYRKVFVKLKSTLCPERAEENQNYYQKMGNQ